MVTARPDTESTPLILRIPASNAPSKPISPRRTRLIIYSVFGIILLAIYNIIFLPRTSLSRDWNRIHTRRLPISELERILFKSISPESIREFSRNYTATPHLGGTNYGLVQWTADKFEEYGIETSIASYDIYLNYPEDHSLVLLNEDGSANFTASLEEDVLEEDPTTGLENRIPTFHGYSASGNVTGQIVYANYGTKDDFDTLVKKGVDFKGKIVIVKYGGLFRGLKVKFAQEHGAIGVIMYSDPVDDGEITEKNGYKPYPEGPARNPSSVQRGSVQFLSYAPGDPTTPGWASKKGAKRVDPHGTTPTIPSLPISYRDALPILKALNGHGLAPKDLGENWSGLLDDVEYNVGPSVQQVNLYNQQEYVTTPNWNVIGKIEGIVDEQAIVIGNHRDAWIAGGAGDPNSGSAVLLELAKAFGELKKTGWKPVRTIYLASWDGEEYGLLGSTEWGEDHEHFLKRKVVAYINVDVAAAGPNFEAEASPLLNDLIRTVARRVPSNNIGSAGATVGPANSTTHTQENTRTVYDDWFERNGARINTLGSGSDFTVFQDFLGIPSLSLGFGGNYSTPVYHYHSNYDSFHWMEKFGDPEWKSHVAAAKIWGLSALTLSEQEVLAFKTNEYANLLKKYVDSLEEKMEGFRHGKKHFQKLQKVLEKFTITTEEYDAYIEDLQDKSTVDHPWYKFGRKVRLLVAIKIANAKLKEFEHIFMFDGGLDDRNWFKHIVFAPGRYTGYAGAILPGITEAIEDNDESRVLKWLGITLEVVKTANKVLGHGGK